ncbi:hypothetical protein [Paraburkholderia sp. MM6662-R1]|uniref:hypothetical protein n=1 Tax=Paraburkholderia sp. MM6662-R1 TaxID=2991066 RepID=UPI003D21ACD2
MELNLVRGALERLTKWRSVFAGWQLGTRSDTDPEAQAVRDHREVTILLRAEFNALAALLVEKGVFTEEEFTAQLGDEAELLSQAYARKFPGYEATDYGMQVDVHTAAKTTKDWRP